MAKHRNNTRVYRGQVFANVSNGVGDQGTALVGPHGQQADPALGKLEHLKGLGNLNQTNQVVGDCSFGANGNIDCKAIG